MRARRKDGRDPKPGDVLYLYTGLRTKKARKLGEHACIGVWSVTIDGAGMMLNGSRLLPEERESFAKNDGFGSFDEMIDWMASEAGREFPWQGVVVYW